MASFAPDNNFNNSQLGDGHAPSLHFVNLVVYDILGRKLATLVNEEKRSGYYEVKFDASDLPSGIYLCRLQAGDKISSIKMNLLK